MFKWLKALSQNQRSNTSPSQPPQVKPVNSSDALEKDKDQLFFEWATETHGDDEGIRLFKAYLEVKRCSSLMSEHGDFVAARQAMLRIALAFPDVGTMAAGTYEPPPITDGYRKWLSRWRVAYPTDYSKRPLVGACGTFGTGEG